MKVVTRWSLTGICLLATITVYVVFKNGKTSSRSQSDIIIVPPFPRESQTFTPLESPLIQVFLNPSTYKPCGMNSICSPPRPQTIEMILSPSSCSFSSCFNISRCRRSQKVYVYNVSENSSLSPIYGKVLKSIRESSLYTTDPNDACIFVLSLDTIDRDRRSEYFVQDMSKHLEQLPSNLWNGGLNHFIINLYHGTFPDYADHDLAFDSGLAMIARASANENSFRRGFDLSFPLFHKELPLRSSDSGPAMSNVNAQRQYLVSFKGKRYVYGIGSETRDSLHHLHDPTSIPMVTTCRHNSDWKNYQDERCDLDNSEYDKWNYAELMANSTFCLTPRGRRLGSFRFLESLSTGCIPVVLSDGWVLPFSEIIDWSLAAVRISEENVLQTPDILYSIASTRISRMRAMCSNIYDRYFSSVEKITLTSLKIVLSRLSQRRVLDMSSLYQLNGHVSAVVISSPHTSTKLQRIIQMLSNIDGVSEVHVLWNSERGGAPVGADFGVNFPVYFEQYDTGSLPLSHLKISSPSVLVIDERVSFSIDDVKQVLSIHKLHPEKIVALHTMEYEHAPSPSELSPGRLVTVAFPSVAVFNSGFLPTTPGCDWLTVQLHSSLYSGSPPLRIGMRANEKWMREQMEEMHACMDKMIADWPWGLQLLPSDWRLLST